MRDLEELVNLYGLAPPGSRMVHPDKQKMKQRGQEAYMDVQAGPN